MDVTVSPKYQIVIPKAIREKHGIQAGDHLVIGEWMGGLRLFKPKSLDELVGSVSLSDSSIEDEPERDLT